MIVEGYTLDLYCDSSQPHAYKADFAQFYGRTRGACQRQARAEGWVFQHNGQVLCPQCNPYKQRKARKAK